MAEHELVQLSESGDGLRVVPLSRPAVSPNLGADGSYRLATLVMGWSGVRIYEAVSETSQSPNGCNRYVALSFAEMERLIEVYTWHRIVLKV